MEECFFFGSKLFNLLLQGTGRQESLNLRLERETAVVAA